MATGNHVTFGDYVRSRGGMLLRAALSLTGGNHADAEDLVQATLMKAYQAWERISDLAAVDTYVRRAMVNTHISGWRKRRVDEYPTDELPDHPSGPDIADEVALRQWVTGALATLTARERAVIVLRRALRSRPSRSGWRQTSASS